MLFKDKKAFLFLRLNGVKQRRFFVLFKFIFLMPEPGGKEYVV